MDVFSGRVRVDGDDVVVAVAVDVWYAVGHVIKNKIVEHKAVFVIVDSIGNEGEAICERVARGEAIGRGGEGELAGEMFPPEGVAGENRFGVCSIRPVCKAGCVVQEIYPCMAVIGGEFHKAIVCKGICMRTIICSEFMGVVPQCSKADLLSYGKGGCVVCRICICCVCKYSAVAGVSDPKDSFVWRAYMPNVVRIGNSIALE